MKFDAHWTFSGGLIFGDAEDESAPMVKVSFHNEIARLPQDERLRVLAWLATQLVEVTPCEP